MRASNCAFCPVAVPVYSHPAYPPQTAPTPGCSDYISQRGDTASPLALPGQMHLCPRRSSYHAHLSAYSKRLVSSCQKSRCLEAIVTPKTQLDASRQSNTAPDVLPSEVGSTRLHHSDSDVWPLVTAGRECHCARTRRPVHEPGNMEQHHKTKRTWGLCLQCCIQFSKQKATSHAPVLDQQALGQATLLPSHSH